MFFKDSNDLLKALFPLPNDSLEQTIKLLNITDVDFEEFRLFFYWTIMSDFHDDVDLEYNGIAYYFYCYAYEKVCHDYAPYIHNQPDKKVVPYIEVINSHRYDKVETPEYLNIEEDDFLHLLEINNECSDPFYQMYDINSNNSSQSFDEWLNEFMQDLSDLDNNVPEEKKTKLFKWFINEVYSDFKRQYGDKIKFEPEAIYNSEKIIQLSSRLPGRN